MELRPYTPYVATFTYPAWYEWFLALRLQVFRTGWYEYEGHWIYIYDWDWDPEKNLLYIYFYTDGSPAKIIIIGIIIAIIGTFAFLSLREIRPIMTHIPPVTFPILAIVGVGIVLLLLLNLLKK